MRIFPAVHYTMGGLWVDYNLMSNIPGLFVLGEANFSDHGANRLGASALMQGLADGYFVIPYTIGNYLSNEIRVKPISTDHEAFVSAEREVKATLDRMLGIKGTKSVDHFHKTLGKIMWNECGMARNPAGLQKAITQIRALREEFWRDLRIPGTGDELIIELGELMCIDALNRGESCGGHFREDHQTEDGEAERHDAEFMYVSAWEYKAPGSFELHKEALHYEVVKPSQRSYK
jgi:succinate dehydrogenase / fumarate reductase flavoprotein subunit